VKGAIALNVVVLVSLLLYFISSCLFSLFIDTHFSFNELIVFFRLKKNLACGASVFFLFPSPRALKRPVKDAHFLFDF